MAELILDHLAAAERMLRELTISCPDPTQPEFEGREEEYRLNIGARSALRSAMEAIELEADTYSGHNSPNPVTAALSAGMRVGEGTSARRFISAFIRAYQGE